MTSHRQGDLARAAQLYAQFLRGEPAHARALRLAGVLARERGDLEVSRGLLERACAAAPEEAAPRNDLALTLLAGGELAAGERALREALARDPDSIRAWANLGALLQYRGHLHAAAECHREVLSRQPDDLEVRCNLASTLLDAGLGQAALAECEAALALAPGQPMLLAAKGAVLVMLDRAAEALACLELATGRRPEDDLAWTNLGEARRQLGDAAGAVRALERACEANPDNARALADLANVLAAGGDISRAIALCSNFLGRHPGERLVLASQAMALRDGGREEEARRLTDLDGMIRVSAPATPDGFASGAEFRAALAELVLADESLLAEPASKATRGGRQTGELDLDAHPALRALARMLDAAVAEAGAALRAAGGPDHPALAVDTGRWNLRAWGTVLEAGGVQAPHQHPLGYLSGVYYLRLPPDMATESAPEAGALEFGLPPSRLTARVAPPTRRLAPSAGRLVVFPSYFWHRTLPFASASPRISIAFDAVPLPR